MHIYEKEVNKIVECNLLHGMINTSKRTKHINIHYSHILHGYMNTKKGIARLNSFQILLDGGCSSTIVMGRLVKKLNLDKNAVIQWHTQAGNITTNLEVKIYFTSPALIATNILTWKCHVDDSTKGRYDMILRQDLLME